MLIGFDGSRIAKKFHTGTEIYALHILKELGKIDKKNQYLIYTPTDIKEKVGDNFSNFSYKIIPLPKLWTQFRLSWEILTQKNPDVLFIPSHTIPFVHPKKTVVTVHDLGFKYFPEIYSKIDMMYQNFGLNMAVKNASHIITISQNSKNDIIKFCNIKPEKISVIYHGYDKNLYYPLKDNEKFSQKIINLKPYIFFIGRLEYKKNIVNILKTYIKLRENNKITHKLVLAGNPGFGYEDYKKLYNVLPQEIKNDIIELGYVSEKEKPDWMRNADVFYFPSLFEGFGFPILESMASGVPVVASNTTSLPEIAGGSALLFDPKKVNEMTDALQNVIINQKLKKELINKGITRASQFSWEKSAKQTLDILEKNIIKEG